MSDQPLNSEYLSQTSDDLFDIAQEAVNFAVAVVNAGKLTPELEEMALELLGTYGDRRRLDVPPLFTAKLLIRNYGEEEFKAMGQTGEISLSVWRAYWESKK